MREKYYQSKDWVMKHPKRVYKSVMTILFISFVFIFIQYYYFAPTVPINNLPNLYSQSDEVKSNMEKNDNRMEKIVKELQQLKHKRESGPLAKNDSIRIEYLFNQYQSLKNGHLKTQF